MDSIATWYCTEVRTCAQGRLHVGHVLVVSVGRTHLLSLTLRRFGLAAHIVLICNLVGVEQTTSSHRHNNTSQIRGNYGLDSDDCGQW